jgi:hypothetical protein
MYAASTFRFQQALEVGLPSMIATTTFWVAVIAWFVTGIGLALTLPAVSESLGRRRRIVG